MDQRHQPGLWLWGGKPVLGSPPELLPPVKERGSGGWLVLLGTVLASAMMVYPTSLDDITMPEAKVVAPLPVQEPPVVQSVPPHDNPSVTEAPPIYEPTLGKQHDKPKPVKKEKRSPFAIHGVLTPPQQ